MRNEKTTKREACQEWVGSFNAINESMLTRAFKDNIDDWSELTTITVGDNAWNNEYQGEYEILSIDEENEKAIINIDGEGKKEVELDDLTVEYEGWLPMWSTLWSFGESMDTEWVRDNLEIVSQCGFRIFEDEETGEIYLGIDGAGYDFYDKHWLPLYEARGLHWHTED